VPSRSHADAPIGDSARRGAEVAVACDDLVVRYGTVTAVGGLSLAGRHGQVLAVLGPNGAGKTSAVETLEGYRRPDAGTVRILGLDPVANHRELVGRIGVMLQRGGVYPTMGPRQALHLFARYYDDPDDPDALLDLMALGPVARTPWRRLSGGEQQRLSLALALVGRPEVLFLDEPTAGVDPEGRLVIRQVVADQRARGACVVLTTHELPEAEHLADEVVIVAGGRAIARGTPAELAAAAGGQAVRFTAPPGLALAELARATGVSLSEVDEALPGQYEVRGPVTPATVAAVAGWLGARDLPVQGLRTTAATLEEAYMRLVTANGSAVRGSAVGNPTARGSADSGPTARGSADSGPTTGESADSGPTTGESTIEPDQTAGHGSGRGGRR
jgi:ABC-2 type transport system ATP-binding protein